MNAELTVIIPFLNEGIEVQHTLESLRRSTATKYKVILINDGSDDTYDYHAVAREYKAHYVEHHSRQGVASSRNEGALLCTTDYMLFLDAHMRIYQDGWVERLVSVAKEQPKSILCAATLDLDMQGMLKRKDQGNGAYIDYQRLKLEWVNNQYLTACEEDVIEVPCVLGASYVCSKAYWQHLGGLDGLRTYGLDEQLISIKARLDGGKCLCVRDVQFGHIFRTLETIPYKFNTPDFLYNILLIAELFYTSEMKIELLRTLRLENSSDIIEEALDTLQANVAEVRKLQQHYQSTFGNNIADLVSSDQLFIKTYLKTKARIDEA